MLDLERLEKPPLLPSGGLFPFSPDIYRFLEKDLFGCVDMDGKNIFSGRKIL